MHVYNAKDNLIMGIMDMFSKYSFTKCGFELSCLTLEKKDYFLELNTTKGHIDSIQNHVKLAALLKFLLGIL